MVPHTPGSDRVSPRCTMYSAYCVRYIHSTKCVSCEEIHKLALVYAH